MHTAPTLLLGHLGLIGSAIIGELSRRGYANITTRAHDALHLTGKLRLAGDLRYFRPTEVDLLVGNATEVRVELGWACRMGFNELLSVMLDADVDELQRCKPFCLDKVLGAGI